MLPRLGTPPQLADTVSLPSCIGSSFPAWGVYLVSAPGMPIHTRAGVKVPWYLTSLGKKDCRGKGKDDDMSS